VWEGILGDCSVGKHVLPHRLTGNHYRDDLTKLLEDVPLAVRARMWYMRDVLSNACLARWIGRGPTLHPWGHLHTLVYAAPVDNEESLHRIVDACQSTRSRGMHALLINVHFHP
jgi:hypothetical protein